MKTKTEIIKETVNFYSENRRGVNEHGSCVYLTETGEKCAIGRCMVDPAAWIGAAGIDDVASYFPIENDQVPIGILKPDYDGHSISFWLDVQGLHDYNRNWDEHGLSPIGIIEVRHLLTKYINQ
jgi:hypothetical protein